MLWITIDSNTNLHLTLIYIFSVVVVLTKPIISFHSCCVLGGSIRIRLKRDRPGLFWFIEGQSPFHSTSWHAKSDSYDPSMTQHNILPSNLHKPSKHACAGKKLTKHGRSILYASKTTNSQPTVAVTYRITLLLYVILPFPKEPTRHSSTFGIEWDSENRIEN